MKNILTTGLLALLFLANSCASSNKDLLEKIKGDLAALELERGQLNGVAKRFNDVQNLIAVAPADLKADPEFGPQFQAVASKADGLAMQYNNSNAAFNDLSERLQKLLDDLTAAKISTENAQTEYEKIASARADAKAGMMAMGSTFDAFSAEYAKLMAAWSAKKDGN